MANKQNQDQNEQQQPLDTTEMEDTMEGSFYSEVERPTSQESDRTEREKEEPLDTE